MRRKLAAGNWKMNGLSANMAEVQSLIAAFPAPQPVDILICPPATLLGALAAQCRGSAIALGGQYCHTATAGAHTGDISAPMLKDAGADYVIVGHSERRADHGETSAQVRAQADAALAAGLTPIICLGESEAERRAGQARAVVEAQLDASLPDEGTFVIAYEPIWAIGTGLVPELGDIAEIHDSMRANLAARYGADAAKSVPLLYGGSVKPTNAAEIFALENVDGALVGGASLKAQDFGPIITALAASDGA